MKCIRHILSVIFMTVATIVSDAVDFAGLDALAIAKKINSELRPAYYANSKEITGTISKYAVDENGRFIDYFSDRTFSSFDMLSLLKTAPDNWWNICIPEYSNHGNDLHNILPAFDTIELSFSDLPAKIRGDIARIYMYMAVMYPATLWGNKAAMFFYDGGWPYLTAYGRQTLLKWHRDDPVDEREILRDNIIADIQGNSNPFVKNAVLAEYIWGQHSGEAYPGENTNPENPENPGKPSDPDEPSDPETPPTQLKGSYSITNDKVIFLRSPYVPSDAVWTLDGNVIEGNKISLDGLKEGHHELIYKASASKGRIIIDIEP